MSEIIQINGDVLAIVVPANYAKEGSEFFSPDYFPLQLGLMKRSAGHRVEAHVHACQQRQILNYQEVLFVRKGRIKVELYDKNNVLVAWRVLSEGDCILLASGGHGVEILDDAEVIEIKQGPFMGKDDKVFIQSK